MTSLTAASISLLAEAPAHAGEPPRWMMWIILLPLLSAAVCGVMALTRDGAWRRWPAVVCCLALAAAFAVSVSAGLGMGQATGEVTILEWIRAGAFAADIAFFVDPLTVIMLLVVTGIGTLVAVYASEYMKGDRGYARFFAFVSLFLAAMTTLVLADNLVLLYLGWEGVGLCSYLLIGFYYQKPAAVAAAKKAFIVNRIGDLGFALGIMLTWLEFGTVEYSALFAAAEGMRPGEAGLAVEVIPFLLMIGAFGKSAQIPLYVWLPDAMEGPTPVSALIHAATMVTAGVYMIARLLPIFVLSEWALPTVAWVGGLTAFFAATIGMAQYDIKRIFAYSTVSQLGYMFLGLGVATSFGAVFHLFTHAFFKALLFLGCGAVMHGFAGQLDLRRLSGLRRVNGWQIVTWTMLIGCLALAGFPLTSGFFSKDAILAQAFLAHGPGFAALGFLGLLTAGMTAYYTFRVFFRVFMGPTHYKPGEEHHGHGDHDHFHPHAPGPAINFVLIVLAIGALLAGFLGVGGGHHGWFGEMIHASSADLPAAHAAGEGFWEDPHRWMPVVASLTGIVGIVVAWLMHHFARSSADRMREGLGGLARLAERKWGVDEGYEALIRRPLHAVGQICYTLGDSLLINGVLEGAAATARGVGATARQAQRGFVQHYGLGMAAGVVGLLALVWWLT